MIHKVLQLRCFVTQNKALIPAETKKTQFLPTSRDPMILKKNLDLVFFLLDRKASLKCMKISLAVIAKPCSSRRVR